MFKNVYQRVMSDKSLRKTNESMSRSKHWFNVALGALWSKTVYLSQIDKKKRSSLKMFEDLCFWAWGIREALNVQKVSRGQGQCCSEASKHLHPHLWVEMGTCLGCTQLCSQSACWCTVLHIVGTSGGLFGK